jgi:hypothetical protein
MSDQQLEPNENGSIDCHLQQVGMGTLVCRAARQTGDRTTNEVNPTICFNCPTGKVFREVGCDAILPKIRIYQYATGPSIRIQNLFCKIRKRDTSLEYCQTCNLVIAETTRQIVSTIQGGFSKHKVSTLHTRIWRKHVSRFEMAISRMQLPEASPVLKARCRFAMRS